MVGKKKKAKMALIAQRAANNPSRKHKATSRAEPKIMRRQNKLDQRQQTERQQQRLLEKKGITAEMWATPAPSHLVARLELPKISTKHKTYFEIADNHEKKKKLEFQVTNDRHPPPGFTFIAVGDPDLTKECKEFSRERDAMIFIVSDSREEHSKVAEHVHRAGYHFRESIVEDARAKLGNRIISSAPIQPGFFEPIPETQEEMNRQAEAALLDLFPRIPNTDREMIVRHAFKKGGTFQGEPTVGNQAEIPLSRRVQLAALAHIRHVHTRYDKLLRETTWMNARKAVEPVCLDILLKWRGDEETGRDQMDEILREVVVITDSEGEEESDDDDEEEDESSDEDGEVTSTSSVGSVEIISRSGPRTQQAPQQIDHVPGQRQLPSFDPRPQPVRPNGHDPVARDRNQQKGFKRYQAAFDDAKNRLKNPAMNARHQSQVPSADMTQGRHTPVASYLPHNTQPQMNSIRPRHPDDFHAFEAQASRAQPLPNYSQSRPTSTNMLRRNEVTMRPFSEHPPYSQAPLPHMHNSFSVAPQVVRDFSAKNGLQDLLVPSIETGPSNSSSSNGLGHSGFRAERNMEPYSRGPHEQRRMSPAARQVIIIDDDSPQPKRRRVVHEEPSHFRPAASLNRPYMQPERFASPRLRSSVQPEEFLPARPRVQPPPAQGLSQRLPGGEQLPVYDAPENGFFAAHPRQLGMQEVEYRAPARYGEGDYRENAQYGRESDRSLPRDNHPLTAPHPHRMMVAEPYHGAAQAPEYRAYSPSEYGRHHTPAVDQDFVHSFSHSHIDPNEARFANPGLPPPQRYEPPYQPFAAATPIRPRSPVQYVETLQPAWGSRADLRNYRGHSAMAPEQPKPSWGGYIDPRAADPRLGRNVIILD